jgi:putative membrane protein
MSDQVIVKELDQSTKLAFDRTWLAEERTLLAWIRTATSLITFGFAIYSFFGIPTGAGHKLASSTLGPRVFAIGLIAIGLIALMGAAIQRRRAVAEMKKLHPGLSIRSISGVVGSLVALMGLFGLVALLVRI